MSPNTHKYRLKSDEKSIEHNNLHKNVINVSRSVGHTGNWIGCGFIDKTGIYRDHDEFLCPFYSLVYVSCGRGEYIDENQRSYPLMSGSLFQRRPGLKHSTRIDPTRAWTEYYIDFNTELYQQLSALGLIEPTSAVYQLIPENYLVTEFKNLLCLLDQSSELRLPDIGLRFIEFARGLINQANLKESAINTNDMIEKCCLEFSLNPQKRINLRLYCEENGWGYESFRKTFKTVIGISPNKYLIRRRLDEACRLLRSTNLRVSEISVNLGYQSQYEFSNQFKRQFGVFPREFRNRPTKQN